MLTSQPVFGITGKVGMVFNAIYFLPTYRQAEGLQQIEWDVAPIPKGPKRRMPRVA